MFDFIKVCFKAMKHGSHGHIFCFDVQYSEWISALAGFKESYEYEDGQGRTVKSEEKNLSTKQRVSCTSEKRTTTIFI